MVLPSDTQNSDWGYDNLQMWNNADLLQLKGRGATGTPYALQLTPLDAKALHVLGLLVRTFDAAGRLLYFGERGPYGDYYLHAFLLACSIIELLTRCRNGDQNLIHCSNAALERGLREVGLNEIHVGLEGYVYNPEQLIALRNLAAHGQGVASVRGRSIPVFLHVELLDHFPERLMQAFNDYYNKLFDPTNSNARRNLAGSGVEPVLYSERSGQVFLSPIKYAYERIYLPQKLPNKVLKYTDWQVYKG